MHEVINGMLARPDGKKIPIAIVPNGSGDDFGSTIGIRSVDQSLDYIVKGHYMACDTVRVLVDHESEDTLPEDDGSKIMQWRHMINNTSLSLPANVVVEAEKYKGCCGKACYSVATVMEAVKCNVRPDLYRVFIDG